MLAKNHGSHVFPPKSGSRASENLVLSGFWFPGGGVLDISLGGEVRLGPSYPDPV